MSTFIKGIGSAAKKFAVGNSEVAAMYLGETKIYENLPYDAEIEYLVFNDGAQIDTGLYSNANTSVEVDAYVPTSSAGTVLEVGRIKWSSSSNTTPFGLSYNYSQSYLYYNLGTTYKQARLSNSGRTVITLNSKYINIYGSRIATGNFAGDNINTMRVCIGANNFGLRVYYIKMIKDGILVCDMIPVRVGTVGYMYDKISKQLFGNSGSGSFTPGSDV